MSDHQSSGGNEQMSQTAPTYLVFGTFLNQHQAVTQGSFEASPQPAKKTETTCGYSNNLFLSLNKDCQQMC